MDEHVVTLERELRELAAALTVTPVGAGLDDAVLARLVGEPVPTGSLPGPVRLFEDVAGWFRARWRAVVSLLVGLGLSLALVPPVRATVAEWFDFRGVVVRQAPDSPGPLPTPTVPEVSPSGTLEEAGQMVGFTPLVPSTLGPPTAVEVSADRELLSMSWTRSDGVFRLDEFDGQVDPMFAKTIESAEYVDMAGGFGLWLPTPHEVVVITHDGEERELTSRVAAQTLVWEMGGTTLRLEGKMSKRRALEIAASVR